VGVTFGGVAVLSGISLDVRAGAIVGVKGGNGRGKTTLLSVAAGALRPSEGEVAIDHEGFGRASAGEVLIGYAPQESALLEQLKVIDNLRFWNAAMRSEHRGDAHAKGSGVAEVAAGARIEGYLSKKVYRLSGGMKKNVNFAVALLGDPDLLILDEPTSGVDADGRRRMADEIKRRAAGGAAVLFTSHGQDEYDIADEIFVLN